MAYISPQSFVHPKAQLADDVVVEPFASIHEDVVIGAGTWVGSNAVLYDGTRIGKNCNIFPGAVIASIPQDLKFKGEQSTVQIGDNVTIREFVTIHRGTAYSHNTIIHDNVLLMAYVHIAHDCIVGKNAILANSVNLAGHVVLEEYAIIGGMCGVHQFVHVGKHVMVAAGCILRKDIPPYTLAGRMPVSYVGVNRRGLQRRGFSQEDIMIIQEIYRLVYLSGLNNTQAIDAIEQSLPDSSYKSEILSFIRRSNRGIMKGLRVRHD